MDDLSLASVVPVTLLFKIYKKLKRIRHYVMLSLLLTVERHPVGKEIDSWKLLLTIAHCSYLDLVNMYSF